MDNVLIFGKDHDERLEKVLKQIETVGVTLKLNKCEFSKSELDTSSTNKMKKQTQQKLKQF